MKIYFINALKLFWIIILLFLSAKPARAEAVYEQRNPEILLESFQENLHQVAERIIPAVVQVNVVEIIRQSVPEGISADNFFLQESGEDQLREKEFRRPGLGSGILLKHIEQKYYVVTNNHVILNADEISIVLYDGTSYKCELIGRDERKDLAVLSFESEKELLLADLGYSSELEVGDWAIAAGSPLGLDSSLTVGIISALGRRGGPGSNISDFIQTDAVINPGNSGGALVNLQGQVVGINTWIASTTGSYMGFGFAIPIDNVKNSIEELITKGETDYGWLGVELVNPIKSLIQSLKIERQTGSLIINMYLGGPAQLSGLLLGDLITHVNGYRIIDTHDLIQTISDSKPGNMININLIRDGEFLNIPIITGKRAKEEKLVLENEKLWPGFFVISSEIKNEIQIALVFNGTPAEKAGFEQGDIIRDINSSRISDMRGFLKILNKKDKQSFDFTILRDMNELEISLIK